ncbi:MAG: argininosuccinate lyase [Pelagibacteraceae bacterium]|nr:argininosuccinate lyase [Pelagibacteraceae bacterium]|tara:strand:- start:2191 stop:3585 length:1395 start_codon:yes stop_codon:yes gene_type:complete
MAEKNKKILSTRINNKTSQLMESINSSIDIDSRLFNEDIEVTRAHAAALHKLKILSNSELIKINKGLNKISKLHKSGKIKFNKSNEDIHMNIEFFLYKIIGETASKIHTGRSRNDQVSADTRLWVLRSCKKLQKQIKKLMSEIVKKSRSYQNNLIPGFTHLQVAQPVTLAHHLLAYYEMFKRDLTQIDFVEKATNENPLGSAALAGSNYDLDINLLNKELGFTYSKKNSLDAVSDRDFCIYFLQSISLINLHLGKLSSELILWSSSQFNLFKISNKYSTGSSIMPQKRNPDSLELIRGKANLTRNQSSNFLNVVANLPLTYFKDFQEDKKIVFDSYDSTKLCLEVITEIIKESKFNTENSLAICDDNFASATDLADYLVVKKKLPFRESYKIIASIVKFAQNNNKTLAKLSLNEFKKFYSKIDQEIYNYIDISKSIFRKKTPMSTNPKKVELAIKRAERFLNKK